MTVKQQELYNVIENLPEELSAKVIDYIDYLNFTYVTNNAPEELIIKSDKDLLNKLKKGMKDTEEGKSVQLMKPLLKSMKYWQTRRFLYW